MSEFSRKLPGSTDLGVALVRGLRESVFMIYVAMALFLFVALVTFDVDDAAWSHLGGAGRVANGAGAVGAWVADILLTVFGVTAYLLPFLLGGYGYTVFLGRSGPGPTALQLGLRWTGFTIAVIASAALADVLLARPPLTLPDSSGGILGRELASRLSGTFGGAGTSILLLALFLAGVSIYTGLSWVGVLAWIGRRFHGVTNGLATMLRGAAADASADVPRTLDQPEAAAPSAKPAAPQRPPLRPFVPEYEDDEEEYRPTGHSTYEVDALDDDDLDRFVPTSAPPPEPMPIHNLVSFDRDDLDIDLEEPSQPVAGPLMRPPSPPKPTPPPPVAKKSNPPSLPTGSLPPVDLLSGNAPKIRGYSTTALEEMSRQVEAILDDFGVEVRVAEVHPGPVITRFEIEPAPGVKVSRISGLAKDLARALSVTSVRVVEVIPGKSVIGLEIPNEERETVLLRSLLSSNAYQEAGGPLTLVLGKDISGHSVVANLARMPHLLVAGTTGSGKSVAVNVMILSMLFKARPDEVRLIMIDPKMLELSVYEGIPHLLTPVVTDMKEAANALRWSVAEMERRYKLMSMLGVRNLAGFNQKVNDAIAAGEPIVDPTWNASEYLEGEEPPTLQPLPFIVIVIDELADMMMIVGKKVEELIARLAQKARAAGLHLILATQRPSVDVITGLIKANIPTRIAFQVSSRIDSRTIIDQGGAEALLGNGDMLYLPPGSGIPIRAHGAFVSDAEVHSVVEFLKRTGRANYLTEITRFSEDNGDGNGYRGGSSGGGGDGEESDPLYDEAVRFVTESRKASISSVQRKFKVGYNRAARMIEDMENAGIVGAAETNGSREVLAPPPPPV